MRKKYIFGKKLYISILTSILVMLTMVATTFAWVGVFANSTFEQFDVNVKASQLDEYSIEVSTTGEEGTFKDYIDTSDLKKAILLNWGYNEYDLSRDSDVDALFDMLDMDQCTTIPVLSNGKIQKLGVFKDLYGEVTHKLYKFDIYIAPKKNYDSQSDSSLFTMDAYLQKGLLTGKVKSKKLVNPYTYSDEFINPLSSTISASSLFQPLTSGTTITEARVDSADASRIAFEKYKVVDKGHPEQYDSNSEPLSAVIYQTGYEWPVYNETENVYCFGSILPDEANLATGYYNSTEQYYTSRHYWNLKMNQEVYSTRGVESSTKDILFNSNTSLLIDSSNPEEIMGLNKMMKIAVYFWFEGWDADCFPAINASPVSININFALSQSEEEF